MATDVKKIMENLLKFYNFNHQTIISVGAGGGQFVEYGRSSKKVIAIDNDQHALEKLEIILQKSQLTDKFTLIHSDFNLVNTKADVVMFEFCLHEMQDPETAVNHALTMAPNILINDHWPDSEWAYIVDEKEKVQKSWAVLKTFELQKVKRYKTFQFFQDYEELYQKVKLQGNHTIQRIERYKNEKNFNIPMTYAFALIQHKPNSNHL